MDHSQASHLSDSIGIVVPFMEICSVVNETPSYQSLWSYCERKHCYGECTNHLYCMKSVLIALFSW